MTKNGENPKVEQIKGHVQNVIKCPKKCDHRKGSFFKEIALVPVESSDAAKLAAKKALSKLSNPVECINYIFMPNVIYQIVPNIPKLPKDAKEASDGAAANELENDGYSAGKAVANDGNWDGAANWAL
ncbi:hypothetical protein BpHYR1_046910 [Brachionus plicatilis]|uniref:Uncharacterized protein n=1 Tax=Brachionus plicatilis TaxID=10195 RepID=A0A3M7RJ02_BRAPC|nr:hypothetical protein BpHYR1_046910 [Brachionus plicatilis]